ncbi:hypothetical protein [Kitasatospora sp. NPDC101183]|uniref:hypothetical protein n=1 Tax=Kitasatospora sp. NPDC101183 TaxID=3364100 RepID=UPI003806CC35
MARRRVVGAVLAGGALVPLALCVLGRWEGRFGGHGAVAEALNRPLLMVGLAGVLLLVGSLVRGRAGAIGLGAGLVGGFAGCVALAAAGVSALGLGGFLPATETRTSSPERADHVLVVVHDEGTGETESQQWTVRLETGGGWTARHWTIVDMRERFPTDGAFGSARWTGPGQITVTSDTGAKVYQVDAASGRPTAVSTTGDVRSLVG